MPVKIYLSAILFLLLNFRNVVLAATVNYNFQISWITANPDGVPRQVIGINGKLIGPTIDVNLNDFLVINVTNVDIINGTGIHWHGMFQRGTPYMDGTSYVTQCPIPPNSSFVYQFTVAQTGTYWYHGHTLTNYVDGLYGALIIRDPNDVYAGQYDDEAVLLIGDWYHQMAFNLLATFMSPQNPDGEEPTPTSVLFNGIGQADCNNLNPPIITEESGSVDEDNDNIFASPQYQIKSCQTGVAPAVIPITPGRTLKLRIINPSAFVRFVVLIEGHNQTIIEADGTPTERLTVNQLLIDVGQRYSVLITGDRAPGNYRINASADPNLGFQLSGIALLQYGGISGVGTIQVPPIENPVTLDPFDLRLDVQAAPSNVIQSFTLTMDFTDNNENINMAIINNSTYMPYSTPLLYLAATNTPAPASVNEYIIPNSGVVEIIMNNRDDGDHPFHLHGHQFAVLAIGNPGDGDFDSSNLTQLQAFNLDNPLLRDTVTVHEGSYMVIRFMADNPGTWIFHCHIDWHMEAGLAVIFNELSASLPPETSTIVGSVCLSPVAPPDMDDPSTYGGVYLGLASILSPHAFLAGVTLTAMLFI